jgi:predicted nicotinamide N-methyase
MSEARACGWVGWEGVKETYALASGGKLTLGVASGSRCPHLCALHAGSVWNGAVRLAQLLESGKLCLAGRTVLELGAGAALPSLVLLAQPQSVLPAALVISDYDDPAIVEAMSDNVASNRHLLCADRCRVVGHTWGHDIAPLTSALAEILGKDGATVGAATVACGDSTTISGSGGATVGGSFDVVLLAEIMWNTDLHAPLIETLTRVLAPAGEVWLCHCHHVSTHPPPNPLAHSRSCPHCARAAAVSSRRRRCKR